jgi:predicted nucleotidyltransferase
MSLVGFDHVFATAQPVSACAGSHAEGDSSTALMLLKIVAFMDDPQQRRVKDLDDIRGLLLQYEAHSERIFSDVVIDAALQDFRLAPAFLMGLDLRALCADDDAQIVYTFLDAMKRSQSSMDGVRPRQRRRRPCRGRRTRPDRHLQTRF